jgi:hypothetical protein
MVVFMMGYGLRVLHEPRFALWPISVMRFTSTAVRLAAVGISHDPVGYANKARRTLYRLASANSV